MTGRALVPSISRHLPWRPVQSAAVVLRIEVDAIKEEVRDGVSDREKIFLTHLSSCAG